MSAQGDGDNGTRGGDESATVTAMRLRYAGTCASCGVRVPAGARAVYERTSKTVTCLACAAGTAATDGPDEAGEQSESTQPGVAGSSARREFERRRSAREQRIRTKHPRLGGVFLALADEPQSTRAWDVGAQGEEALGQRLDGLASPSVRVLHDRRIPKTRANIDHVVCCPAGVFVIDAKRYAGRPRLRVEGGFLRERTEKLMVGARDCSKLVDGVTKQVELVRDALDDEAVPVRGFLCFVAADWPLFGGSFTTRGVTALWPKKLATVIGEPGVLDHERVASIHRRLARAFPMA